jgi:hypothetical protein
MIRPITALVFCALCAQTALAQTTATYPGRTLAGHEDRDKEWEIRYKKWTEEQSRLDDGFLFSLAIGFSPLSINTTLSGGNNSEFPSSPPFSRLNFTGLGGIIDARMGWLVANDPFLADRQVGNEDLHDQLYVTWDVISRSTPFPALRITQGDTTSDFDVFKPSYILDVMTGMGVTYIVYPYRVSFSTTLGFGFLGMQDFNQSVRTDIGPAFNLRIAHERNLRENWRSGIGINYGFIQSVNPPQVVNNAESYREIYGSHMLSVQWLNSFTPPKYRRGVPPARPR